MEIKEIPIDKILANFNQPREKFDKEGIKELAESILSNGLLNPISVREWKNGKYMIVAGERRWMAHKVAGLKTISAFIKKYKDDGQWMIESLIENTHREDLSPFEKGKYAKKIMDLLKISSYKELSRRIKASDKALADWIDTYEYQTRTRSRSDHTLIRATRGMEDKERKEIIQFAEKKEIPARQMQERIVPIIRQSPSDVKKALLSDEINVEQAERISKLQDAEERKQAIQQHKNIAIVDKNIEEDMKIIKSAKENREFKKKLVQAGNWITSFRGSVTDSSKVLERTIKLLLISTQFISVMDEKQKETFLQQLDRFIEILDKGKQLAEQIREKLE